MNNKTKLISVVILIGLLVITSGTRLSKSMETTANGVITPLLQYQGRLTDVSTGQIVADGTYSISFQLYNVESGGSALWTENKSVSVQGGLFSTILGDTNPLVSSLFNGQALWLGITMDGEQLEPRQPVLPVAYALSLVPGAIVQGDSVPVFQVNHLGGGEALRVGGNLNVSGSLIGGSHNHSGGDITSGTVADARIASTIARDSEIMSTVLANDGAGSGLQADYLDGYHASAFAFLTHYHDDRYYTESESNSSFVNATGDTMSGVLTVPYINYSSPRTHYFRVGGEGFVPGSNVDYSNTYGMGGAYIVSSSGAMVAPVHLPQGAVVTSFRVYFYDNSTSDMTVYLYHIPGTGGYTSLAVVDSTGISGYANKADSTISNATIDNFSYSYIIYAYSSSWDSSNLRIMGALITYTINQAP
jgi:hypothetical protein